MNNSESLRQNLQIIEYTYNLSFKRGLFVQIIAIIV